MVIDGNKNLFLFLLLPFDLDRIALPLSLMVFPTFTCILMYKYGWYFCGAQSTTGSWLPFLHWHGQLYWLNQGMLGRVWWKSPV
uniref:Uncharacterized protein n=1 Tax=Anguilla anguilla TaxID=7936 RepID=A0A0E9WB85_ANGAN